MKKDGDVELVNRILRENFISKSDLAGKIGISRQYLSQIINGTRGMSSTTRSKLQAAYPSYFNAVQVTIPDKIDKTTLIKIRAHYGYTQAQLAKKLEISQSLLAKYETGERVISKPATDKLKALAGSIKNVSDKEDVIVSIRYNPDYYLSDINSRKETSESIYMDKRLLLSNKLSINPLQCEIVSVYGDSLSPVYSHGDMVIIDWSIKHFIDNQISFFMVNNCYYLRKISITPNKIKCMPLNDKFDTFYLDRGKEHDVFGLIIPKIRL